MRSRATVTRPTGVRPMRTAPCQRKCFAHLLRRGLKSGVSLRVFGSRLLISDPLKELQKTQTDYTRSSALSILGAAPHNRGSGALEAGGLEPASPGTT